MRQLSKGENSSLPTRRVSIRVTAAVPVDVCALLLGADGKVATEGDFVFYNQPSATGVVLAEHGVDLDVEAFPASVERAICAVSVDDVAHPLTVGVTLTAALIGPDGVPLFEFSPSGLAGERAVIVFEIYRRQQEWKVRAVGQGYADGLAALVAAHGVEVEPDRPREPVIATATMPPAQPVSRGPGAAPPPPGTSAPERQMRVLTAIFEDAARSAAAYRSAVTFAEQRRERELDSVFDDPRLRETASPARQLADERYAELVMRATADHRRDVDHLANELRELTGSLPAALAPWDAPVWNRREFGAAAGVRAGQLHLPEAPDLKIPLVLGLPLRRPLWLHGSHDDASAGMLWGHSSPTAGDGSADGGPIGMARALIMRLFAADSSIRLHLCDVDGSLAAALGHLAGPAAGLLGAPVARTREQRSETLRVLAERIDLLEMARSAGALDELPLADTTVLLVMTDVPVGFDEADHQRLRYLVERAPASRMLVLLLGDPHQAGASIEVARASLRLGPEVGEDISDGWVGMAWTFTPDFGPTDPASIVFRT
ncbi:stress response protein SCP2 [Nakamurella sp. UYEF19]|uniref:TerD family protein n=1 Tax=Nakamurella sp. UYEF19 TaxID=1756392 RepID=UPI003399E3C0